LAQGLETGKQAPRFSLLDAGLGRRVDTRSVIGRKVVLIFHLQGTAPTAREINHAVRAHHPDPEDVLVASVIDLSIVPPFYWMSVGLILNQAYDRATEELPPDANPADTSSSSPTGAASSAAITAPGTRAVRRPSSFWTRKAALRSPTRGAARRGGTGDDRSDLDPA